MTDRELERRAQRRLAVLRHVEEVSGNVAATCRYYGISRQCYYGWLRRYEADGLDGLKDRSSRARVGGLLQLPPPSRRSQRPNALRAPPPESPRPAVIGVVSSAALIRWACVDPSVGYVALGPVGGSDLGHADAWSRHEC